jgi:dihydropteroate synthase
MDPMHRRLFYWKLKSREIKLGERTVILGVLNVTPDSFSDGGKYLEPDRAFARALELEEQGADIIDIGAESTKPGAKPVSAEEEWKRLVQVLKRLAGKLTLPISVDTYKADVAERALSHGAEIINDPSGLTFDAQIAKVVAQHDAGLILNHMRGRPETWAKLPSLRDVMGTIERELAAAVSRARHAGLDRARLAIDPGIGFGKRKEQNSQILAELPQLARLELPIMAGPSRKSFLTQASPRMTEFATAAAVAAAVLHGAHMVRVHQVPEMRVVTDVVDEILRHAVVPE